MKKVLQFFLLFFYCNHLFGLDHNLVIIVDNLQQETVKTTEVNMTHQCITVLQQRASMLLVSGGLWKNIVDRKKNFEKNLQDPESIESKIFNMYQATNKELQDARYNLTFINQKLSQNWFSQNYPQLAQLSHDQLNQLRFNFLCYTFEFDMSSWRVYSSHAGMLLFVPKECNYYIDEHYQLFNEQDLRKHIDKKSHVVSSLQKLLKTDKDRWVIYLTGHGHPKSSKQGANIAGLKIDEFKRLLHYCNDAMKLKLLVYSSCYGGGVHTVEPYANLQLNYPVIITAVTDAPIFGFGLFEGVKLPPYDDQFKLQSTDVSKKYGLLPCALQNYTAFFKRAWKGQFDLYLVQLISKFFACDFMQCHVQKVENFPLIRKAKSTIFTPVRDGIMMKLIQQVTTNSVIVASKPLLLYTKKVKKIKTDQALPIISMLPGITSHEIGELIAPQVLLSELINQSFLSLEDMQAYKNFMIKKLICFNDVIGNNQKIETFTRVLILDQQNLTPRFLDKPSQALIYCQLADSHYLLLWNDQKITEIAQLDQDQIIAMAALEKLVQQAVNFDSHVTSEKLLTFDTYLENKAYQREIVDDCIKNKVCKK
ncbi:MAG: hypothetical protein JO129_03830 [Candidatus Dependentiae bacterium]|nr:hypothetical protein [Candidatus Dependentiae bacterium]